MNNLSDLDLKNKRLLIRADMNVPIQNGTVKDNTRILASLPTIEMCLEAGAKVLLISHLGRPIEGNPEKIFSLQPVAEALSKIINEPVELVSEISSSKLFNSSSKIQMLENIRFFKGEKANSELLGKQLADLCDIYVFDAFGTSHREQASTHSAITQSNQAYSGYY